MQSEAQNRMLSTKVRILLGIVAIPSLALGAMVTMLIMNGQTADISLF